MSNPGFTTHFPGGYPAFHTPRQGPFGGGGSGPSKSPEASGSSTSPGAPHFDIFEWHPAYQSCQRYFLDHAQHNPGVHAVAALINIQLPFQWSASPIANSTGPLPHSSGPGAYNLPWPRPGPVSNSSSQPMPTWVSLVPYIRRLVITGMDREPVMHGFFGDDWRKGVGPVHECERRNYLFAAKSVGWASVKVQYDMGPHETVPFVKPLQDVSEAELVSADSTWGQFIAMEDWMLGPRAPASTSTSRRPEP
ncbi:hypothetical protein CC80DRAFT_85161 [Byssothecium circinans]|uniref:Ilp is an apoptosis inhibitor n=1 Tax=Byssothecium circinans TaxID=147558 RepID=A0A6A5TT44_9PLEO|nr:hypothetical protein CC80DRAFT_85161 [Byssothecium circinans]